MVVERSAASRATVVVAVALVVVAVVAVAVESWWAAVAVAEVEDDRSSPWQPLAV